MREILQLSMNFPVFCWDEFLHEINQLELAEYDACSAANILALPRSGVGDTTAYVADVACGSLRRSFCL